MTHIRKPTKQAPLPPAPPPPAELDDTFLQAFLADWHENDNGKNVIKSLRADKPADYVRIAAAIFAKQAEQESDPLHDLTDDELIDRIAETAARIGLEIRARPSARRAGPAQDREATEP